MNDQSNKGFDITVSFNGAEKTLSFNPHEAMKAVLERALNAFGIASNRHVMALFFSDNREITDLAKSVSEWGIVAGTKLVLRQSTILAG